MERISFQDARRMLRDVSYMGSEDGEILSVTVDSREVTPGALFVALKGKRHDGHTFVSGAIRKGAAAVVVEQDVKAPRRVAVFRVQNTLRALGRLGRGYLDRTGAKVIAITGSNGKTTTKEMLYHILRKSFKCMRSPKSFNTEIGVPLSIFEAETGQDYIILEMGTNARGEISRMARIAPPVIGILTNISRTHLQGLHDLPGVARAKGELLDALKRDNIAVINCDNKWCRRAANHTRARVVRFGLEADCDVFASDVGITAAGSHFKLNDEVPVKLKTPGGHNIGNALAAAATAIQLGVEPELIARRLGSFKLPEMRMQRTVVASVTLINDAYNANEASVAVAADYLNRLKAKGTRCFVFGDMGELGQETGRAHRNVGMILGGMKIDYIVTVGEQAAEAAHEARRLRRGSASVSSYGTVSGAARFLISRVQPGDVVLFKASRFMDFEKLHDEVREALKKRKGASRA